MSGRITGYVLDGVYYRGTPDLPSMTQDVQTTYKDWSHTKQRREHRRDLIQPYKNGKPNPEFIQAYPEESKINGFV